MRELIANPIRRYRANTKRTNPDPLVAIGAVAAASLVGWIGYSIWKRRGALGQVIATGEANGRHWEIVTGANRCPAGYAWRVYVIRVVPVPPPPPGLPKGPSVHQVTETIAHGCETTQEIAQQQIDDVLLSA